MAYPADAFNGGVLGFWVDAQAISNFKLDTVALSTYGTEEDSVGYADQWVDLSGNNLHLLPNPDEWIMRAINDDGYKKAFFWSGSSVRSNCGGSTTGFYFAAAIQATSGWQQWNVTFLSDIDTANTGFSLAYDGDDGF